MGNGVSLVVSTAQQILLGCAYQGECQNIHSVHEEVHAKYSQSVRYLRSSIK